MSITTTPYGFIPTQVSNCSLWLDAADSSTVTLSGSTATQWNDKSGNGRNSTSCSATYSDRINGLSCMTNPIISGPITNSGSSIVTIFIVGTKASTGGLYDSMLALNLSPITNYYGAGTLFACYYGGTNPPQFYCYMSGNLSLSFVGAVNTTFIFNAFQTGTTGSTYGNGTSYGDVGTAGSTFNYTTYYIGLCTGGPAWVGNVCEVIVYNSILSISQRQQVESYLAQKWDIKSSLPVAHPGLSSTVYQSSYLKIAGVKKNVATMVPFYTAFTPRQIAGCSLWLDAADSTTITLSSGNMIQWNDKSGNGYNLTPFGGYSNVTVSSSYKNFLNVLNFSGSGLYRSPASSSVYPQDCYIVLALKDITTRVDVFSMGATSIDNFNSLTFGEHTANRWHNGSTNFTRTPACVAPTNETSTEFLIMNWSIADANFLIRRNGTQIIQTSSYSYTPTSGAIYQLGLRAPHYSGMDAPFRGYIAEIIVYNSQLGTTQQQQIESYLAQKWGLVSSLPGGHLNATQPAGARTALSLANSKFTLTRYGIAATGGTVTTANGYRIHTFTSVGSTNFIVTNGGTAQVLVAGGGGGGGGNYTGGGGGAGGAVFNSAFSITAGTYSVTVGALGAGWAGYSVASGTGSKGGDSTFSNITGYGGGGGGDPTNASYNSYMDGGCGGGAGGPNASTYVGVGSQGGNGGAGTGGTGCGGGGGMGGVGVACVSGQSGAGGPGATYTIGGQSYLICGGGGGGGYTSGGFTRGLGGSGIGGAGGTMDSLNGFPATYYGSGGGGSPGNSAPGGNGYQGIVIIAYRV